MGAAGPVTEVVPSSTCGATAGGGCSLGLVVSSVVDMVVKDKEEMCTALVAVAGNYAQ